jgi:hypothetical protein
MTDILCVWFCVCCIIRKEMSKRKREERDARYASYATYPANGEF